MSSSALKLVPNQDDNNADPEELYQIERYIVTGELGKGATGRVLRAEDTVLQRPVALKLLSSEFGGAQRAQFRERFLREARAAGRLSHPNLVTIYDVGEVNDIPYIAMEYLSGLTLREYMDSGAVLPVRKAIDIGVLAMRGLDYAHKHGIIHRDIKPENLMMARNGVVKIMDFGTAAALSSEDGRDSAGGIEGSPRYMAPEQIRTSTSNRRSDLFSLGVTIYEMLTGQNPFDGNSVKEVAQRVLYEDVPPPSSLNPDVSPQLDSIILRALVKEPTQRFHTAKEFGLELMEERKRIKVQGDEGREIDTQDAVGVITAEGSESLRKKRSRRSSSKAGQRKANRQHKYAAKQTWPWGVIAVAGIASVILMAAVGWWRQSSDVVDESTAVAPHQVPTEGAETRVVPSSVAVETGQERAPVVSNPVVVTEGDTFDKDLFSNEIKGSSVSANHDHAAVSSQDEFDLFAVETTSPEDIEFNEDLFADISERAVTVPVDIKATPVKKVVVGSSGAPISEPAVMVTADDAKAETVIQSKEEKKKEIAAAKPPKVVAKTPVRTSKPPIVKAAPSGKPVAVSLNVLPWGQVFVDGVDKGVTPPLRVIQLPPGLHRIEVRNSGFRSYVKRIRIQANKPYTIQHRFGK